GGSKGIGLETVLRFVDLGYQVITCSRSKQSWLEAVNEFPQLSVVDYQIVDISSESELEKLFDHIKNQYGFLDIAVNNASPALVSGGQFKEVDVSSLQETLNVDFWSQAL
ncbi:SDR family oxidoreductase, partial [Vibrio diabolicus]